MSGNDMFGVNGWCKYFCPVNQKPFKSSVFLRTCIKRETVNSRVEVVGCVAETERCW